MISCFGGEPLILILIDLARILEKEQNQEKED